MLNSLKNCSIHKGGNMNSVGLSTNRLRQWPSASVGIIAVAILLFGAFPAAFAAGTLQKNFASPEDAVKSLVEAVRANDIKEMMAILGPGSKELISSGDDMADRVGRGKFIRAYDQKNTLQEQSAHRVTLCTGEDNWPMPIPIVKKGSAWVFDIREGKRQILDRRVGRNELYIMDVLHAYVDAQHDYASKNLSGSGAVVFAQRIVSSKGRRDGLYWDAKEGEEQSPLGPLVAQAAKEGYANPDLSPFHGYYFKILKGQGKNADGGAYNYVVKGKMILGFALLAYPAEYGNSGVMTFMVNQEGAIYQRNLGRDTRRKAEAIKLFDPDKSWTRVKEPGKKE
jgi:hypothetical protein